MSNVKGKNANAALGTKIKTKRKWLTFIRMCRYGIDNFSRNAWLTTAATAVMVVTLLIIFSTIAARNVFADTLTELRAKVDVSVFLKDEATTPDVDKAKQKLESSPLVTSVDYVSKDEAKKRFTSEDTTSLEVLQALTEVEGNPLPASLRIKVEDPSKLEALDPLVESTEIKKVQNTELPTALGGDRRATLDNIGRIAVFTEQVGLILCAIAIVISILIIFNTIRMAIFNRRDEIQMMKLIGADKNFIQGPFIVEAVMYGVLAAIITSALVLPLAITQSDTLAKYEVVVGPTVQFLKDFPSLVILGLMIVGAIIGVISSLLAIRRYLKV